MKCGEKGTYMSGRTDYIASTREVEAILRCAQRGDADGLRELVPFLAVGFFAGPRAAELANLSWPDVWGNPGGIVIWEMRTGRRRIVRMSSNLRAWLLPWRGSTGAVVPSEKTLARLKAKLRSVSGAAWWSVAAMRCAFAVYRVPVAGWAAVAAEMGKPQAAVCRHDGHCWPVTTEDARAFWRIYP